MIVKRIYHYSKKPLLAIDSTNYSFTTTYLRTQSAPPQSSLMDLPVVENKAVELKTEDGKSLKELLENFVDSSDEESTEASESEEKIEIETIKYTTVKEVIEKEEIKIELDSDIRNIIKDEIKEEIREEIREEIIKEENKEKIIQEDAQSVIEESAHNILVDIPRKKFVYPIEEIFNVKEREKIEVNVDKKIFLDNKMRVVKKKFDKREEIIRSFRLELNRIALSNAKETLERIKRIKVIEEADMKAMANVLYEKAISETTFAKLYAFVIKELSKCFKTEKENKTNPPKTIFFSTLIKLCQTTIANKEKWSEKDNISESNLTYQEKLEEHNILEEKFTEKSKRRERYLGTIRLITLMYTYTIISYKAINMCINSLLTDMDEEDVETLCFLLENTVEKLVNCDKKDVVIKITNQLKTAVENMDNRIKFMVFDTIDKVKEYITPKNAKKEKIMQKNTFSGLKVERENIITLEDIKKVSNITDEVHLMNIDEMERLVDEIKEKEKKNEIKKKMFIEAYIQVTLENFNHFYSHLQFITILLNNFLPSSELSSILVNINDKLGDIVLDSPFAEKNFHILLFVLKVRKYIRNTPIAIKKSNLDIDNIKSILEEEDKIQIEEELKLLKN